MRRKYLAILVVTTFASLIGCSQEESNRADSADSNLVQTDSSRTVFDDNSRSIANTEISSNSLQLLVENASLISAVDNEMEKRKLLNDIAEYDEEYGLDDPNYKSQVLNILIEDYQQADESWRRFVGRWLSNYFDYYYADLSDEVKQSLEYLSNVPVGNLSDFEIFLLGIHQVDGYEEVVDDLLESKFDLSSSTIAYQESWDELSFGEWAALVMKARNDKGSFVLQTISVVENTGNYRKGGLIRDISLIDDQRIISYLAGIAFSDEEIPSPIEGGTKGEKLAWASFESLSRLLQGFPFDSTEKSDGKLTEMRAWLNSELARLGINPVEQ